MEEAEVAGELPAKKKAQSDRDKSEKELDKVF